MINDNSMKISGYSLGGLIRRVRRTADMSQRELAKYAKVSPSSIGSFETGATTPSLPVLQRVLNAANYQLVVIDADGHLITPLVVWEDITDGAGRRFPAHLDTILDPVYGEWWADVYGLTAPPETFRKNRRYRDWQRQQSRWEVRAKQLRHARPPRKPYGRRGWEMIPDAGEHPQPEWFPVLNLEAVPDANDDS